MSEEFELNLMIKVVPNQKKKKIIAFKFNSAPQNEIQHTQKGVLTVKSACLFL